jgi:hypothetical protein
MRGPVQERFVAPHIKVGEATGDQVNRVSCTRESGAEIGFIASLVLSRSDRVRDHLFTKYIFQVEASPDKKEEFYMVARQHKIRAKYIT